MKKIIGKIIRFIFSKIRGIRIKRIDPRKIDWKKLNRKDMEENLKKALRSPYLYLSLGLVIGVVLTLQFRTEAKRPLNPALFYNELVDVRGGFLAKKSSLNSQIKDMQSEIKQKEVALTNKNFISQTLLNNITNQELIFGSTNVVGGGLAITISDGTNQVKDEFSKSLTHAADLRDIVNLLWYAGAEAISINGERIIYNTSIDCIVSTIMINNNNYVPPFEIKAIGNKYDLYGVINSSRKLVDIKKRTTKKQIGFDMQMKDNLEVKSYSGVYLNM